MIVARAKTKNSSPIFTVIFLHCSNYKAFTYVTSFYEVWYEVSFIQIVFISLSFAQICDWQSFTKSQMSILIVAWTCAMKYFWDCFCCNSLLHKILQFVFSSYIWKLIHFFLINVTFFTYCIIWKNCNYYRKNLHGNEPYEDPKN